MKAYLAAAEKLVTFAEIAKISNQLANVGSYIAGEFDAFAVEHFGERPFVAIASHSMGGREFLSAEGADPIYFVEETFSGGWRLFEEADILSCRFTSATSGSVLQADRLQVAPGGQRAWRLTLLIPAAEGGGEYHGCYSGLFDEAVEIA